MMKKMKNNRLCFLNPPRIKDDRSFDFVNKPHINHFPRVSFKMGNKSVYMLPLNNKFKLNRAFLFAFVLSSKINSVT